MERPRGSGTLPDMVDSMRFPIDEVAGLPLHPLAVHAAVVLIPLAALGLIVMASSGKRSKRYSPLVVFVGVVAVAAAFISQWSGQALRTAATDPGGSEHFRYGEWLPWVAVATLALIIILALMDRQGGGKRNAVGTLLSLLAIVVSLVAIGATVVVGFSGAQLVWG